MKVVQSRLGHFWSSFGALRRFGFGGAQRSRLRCSFQALMPSGQPGAQVGAVL